MLQFANLAEGGRGKNISHWSVQCEQLTLPAAASAPWNIPTIKTGP